MSAPKPLPPHPHPDWYRKAAKKRLAELRVRRPGTKLADAQLELASEHGFASWRKLLAAIEAGVLASSRVELFGAIRRDDYDAIRRLLASHPKLAAARDEDGETALHLAVEVNNPDTVDILVAHGADPGSRLGSSSHTALSWAATTMADEAAAALLKAGVEPDLFCAAGLGLLDAVRSFFDAGRRVAPNASRTGSSRFTRDGKRLPCPPREPQEIVSDALYLACRNARVPVVGELLSRDVDVNFRAFLGGTPLHWAHFGGPRGTTELLLAAGADPTLRDDVHDCTPRAFGICVAASWGFPQIVARRLQEDLTLARVHDGRGTPLHEAARGGHEQVVRVLLAAGADASVRDRGGASAADLAKAAGHEAVVALLAARRD